VALVVINQLQVAINVRLSFFNRDWFNAIQNKDFAAFWSLLFGVFCFWAAIGTVLFSRVLCGNSRHRISAASKYQCRLVLHQGWMLLVRASRALPFPRDLKELRLIKVAAHELRRYRQTA
jgi:hypothetical protein